ESNILLRPTTILTDFELVAINASHSEFPSVHNKGCFFHLGQ
ncbi:36174_t:CDS:1, partial [Gigaspora margarita]